jgi:hypothetical protein
MVHLPATLLVGTNGETFLNPDQAELLMPPAGGRSRIIAKFRDATEHDWRHTVALLVREDWLGDRLATLDLDLVIGLLGERQQLTGSPPRHWRTLDQVAVLTRSGWEVRPLRTKHKVSGTDP